MDSLKELSDEMAELVKMELADEVSISIEANELLECFQWDDVNYCIEDVKEELADVVNYCIQMADKLNVDLKEIVIEKLKKTEEKYPVEKSKGVSTKYNRL